MLKALAIFVALLFLAAGCRPFFFYHSSRFGYYSKLQEAEELSRQGRYGQAITAYREHMNYRLSIKQRPQWENPYFYYVLIGDIHLGQGEVEQAVQSYKLADEKQVDKYLIADRYRSVAAWYENQNRLAEAIDFLSRHRHGDPLLIDAMLDRLSKQLVRQEEAERSGNAKKPLASSAITSKPQADDHPATPP